MNRTSTEQEQYDTGDDGSDVTVENSRECVRETIGDSGRKVFTCTQLLFDTLVDNYVGIDCHTHCQDDTGDTGQGQNSTERREDTHHQEYVAQQSQVSKPTCTAVEQSHVEKYQAECDKERNHTELNRLLTERRTYHFIIDNARGSGQFTRFEQVSKVGSLLDSEVTGDLRTTTCNLAVYGRSRVNITIKNDSDAAVKVVSCHTSPSASTCCVHCHINLCRRTCLSIGCLCVGDNTAIEGCLTVTSVSFDSVELESGVSLVHTLCTPHQTEVTGEESFNLGQFEHLVYSSHVVAVSNTDNGTTIKLACLIHPRSKFREQGVSLFPSLNVCFVLLAYAVAELSEELVILFGSSSLGILLGALCLCVLSEQGVYLAQEGENLVVVVGSPELQRSSTLQKVTNTLGLFNAGQLNQDTVVFELLNVGLCYTETVDTATQDVERVVECAFRLGTKNLDNLAVAALSVDVLFELRSVEERCEGCATRNFVISVSESGDEVCAGSLCLASFAESLVKHRILVVVRQRTNYIFGRNLQHHVHTATKVKTEVQLFLFYLAVVKLNETEVVNGLVFNRVQISNLFHCLLLRSKLCGIFGRIALYTSAYKSKREVVSAGECSEHCQQFKCTFVLHFEMILFSFNCYCVNGMLTIERKSTKKLSKNNINIGIILSKKHKKAVATLSRTAF